MVTTKIAGVETPLKLTLDAMDAIEQATGKSIVEMSFSIKTTDQRAELLETLSALITAAGGIATVDTLREEMSPGELLAAVYRVIDAVNEGMAMETDKPAEDEEVDLVLEELKKNVPEAASPGE